MRIKFCDSIKIADVLEICQKYNCQLRYISGGDYIMVEKQVAAESERISGTLHINKINELIQRKKRRANNKRKHISHISGWPKFT